MGKNRPLVVVKFPSYEVMLKNLLSVSNRQDYVDFLYPTFLKYAGGEATEEGMMGMIENAIAEYRRHVHTIASMFMWFKTKRLIDSLVKGSTSRTIE